MYITTGPTGNVITGDVLDVNKKALDRALKAYDSQLYTKWNPKKCYGWGCWEVRRRPDNKVIVDYAEYNQDLFLRLEYKELDHIHHVFDLAFLNYRVIEKIKSMDTWATMSRVNEKNVSQWVKNLESKESEAQQAMEDKIREDRLYALKQMKTQMAQLKEAVLSGVNPHLIAHMMGQSK